MKWIKKDLADLENEDFKEMEERTIPGAGVFIWPVVVVLFALFLSWVHGWITTFPIRLPW